MPQVNIREDIYRKVEDYIRETGAFSSVEEFVNYVLDELLKEERAELTPEEEEKVRERLRALGYI